MKMKNTMNYGLSIAFFVAFALSGCGGELLHVRSTYKAPDYTEPKQVLEKNYGLGRSQEAYIGNSIVRVKEYYVKEKKSYADTYWKSEDDFVISKMNGGVLISNQKEDRFREEGMVTLGGVDYYVLKITKTNYKKSPVFTHSLLISKDGIIHNKLMLNLKGPNNTVNSIPTDELKVQPGSAMFSRLSSEVETEVVTEKGYINYELIYGGATNSEIKITYREYSPDGMARQAFYQNLVYARGQKIIRFKNLKIQVHSVDNQRIVYTVLSDTEG